MSRRRRTIAEECVSLRQRHNALNNTRKAHLQIYLGSLNERLRSIEYALNNLRNLSGSPTEATDALARQQKRQFYATSFWALSYSVFDIIAHVINTVYPIITDERRVSFFGARDHYKGVGSQLKDTSLALPPRLLSSIKRVASRQYLKRLRRYRQCCLHRRDVCVAEEATTTTLSAAYATTTEEPVVTAIICDDPDTMKPKFDRNRELIREAQNIRDSLEEDLRGILKVI